jgi:hypothetical protein
MRKGAAGEMRILPNVILASISLLAIAVASGQEQPPRQMLLSSLMHLRSGPVREWSSFPEQPTGSHWEARFPARKNEREQALRLRQQDVKQAWRVLLNSKPLGELVRDENDQVLYLALPAGALIDGENVLRVEARSAARELSDDIHLGEVLIEGRDVAAALSESTLHLQVVDETTGKPTPARLTIVNAEGALAALGTASNDELAVRSGVVYTATGAARVALPAGDYTVFAGRGFEYSVAEAKVRVAAGQTSERKLSIRREVATDGYVACDTHIHTRTHSGHGDASLIERMITLAGEGIELPIATDHNVHIDYEAEARRLGVRPHFTPVVGTEVTTSVGHFNVFPIGPAAAIPDFRQKAWPAIFDSIFATRGVKVAILNHARDVHSGTRPFGPKLFNTPAGENIEGWPMRFNAMEVINSGATQTDPLRLVHDWMALQSRGHNVTPIGSSDSHDVSRYIVGQGRTYIRADDRDPASIGVDAAVDNLLAGRALVSYGLFVEPIVNNKYRIGDFAQLTGDTVKLEVRVLSPSWNKATSLRAYCNGTVVKSIESNDGLAASHALTLPRPKYDAHLVVVALGPGIENLHWPTAKPYQPTSPDWSPYTLAVSGAIWLDGDGDGHRSTPRQYAERLVADCRGDPAKVCEALRSFDSATAAQAAHILQVAGVPLESCPAFADYLAAWRENERARAAP